jgi:hypothetical protein
MNIELIKSNFFNLEQELVDSNIKEFLIPLRDGYRVDISGPGCTPCKRNSAIRKYTALIEQKIQQNNGLIN